MYISDVVLALNSSLYFYYLNPNEVSDFLLKALIFSSKYLRARAFYLPIPVLLSRCLVIQLISFYADSSFALEYVVEIFAIVSIDSLIQISLFYISLFHYNASHNPHDVALFSFKPGLAISAFLISVVYFPPPLQTISDGNMLHRSLMIKYHLM